MNFTDDEGHTLTSSPTSNDFFLTMEDGESAITVALDPLSAANLVGSLSTWLEMTQ